MLTTPFALVAIGFLLERIVVRHFYATPIAAVFATYALNVVIRESVRSLIGDLSCLGI